MRKAMEYLVDKGLIHRRRGAINALAAAFPLTFTSDPAAAREKVGIIAYRTRPSDDHPHLDRRGYAMEMRVYRFEPDGKGGTFAQLDRGATHSLDDDDEMGSQHFIKEQVARLDKQGFRHIVLLSHHFGNRHLARAAQRHSPHTRTGFIDELGSPAVGRIDNPYGDRNLVCSCPPVDLGA